MRPVLYLYRSCTSCRNAESMLKERGIDVDRREFFNDRFSEDELRDVLERAGMTPSELVSRRSKVFRDNRLADQEIDEDGWVAWMLREPTLIRRPILVTHDDVVVGFSKATYATLMERLDGSGQRS